MQSHIICLADRVPAKRLNIVIVASVLGSPNNQNQSLIRRYYLEILYLQRYNPTGSNLI